MYGNIHKKKSFSTEIKVVLLIFQIAMPCLILCKYYLQAVTISGRASLCRTKQIK